MSIRLKTFFIIILLIITAGFFRLYNLPNRGLISYDEGQFLSEAQYTNYVIKWFTKFGSTLALSKDKARVVEHSVNNFKPTGGILRTGRILHTSILALGIFFDRIGVYSSLYLMAFFGIGGVLLTYIFAFLITKSRKIAFISSIILAFLPYHIIYSRSTLSEMDSEFFFLISLILYVFYRRNNNNWHYFFSSLLIGICFITNGDRMSFFALPLVEIILNRTNWVKSIQSILIFFIAFVIPAIFAELPYHIAFLLTHNLNIVMTAPSYIEQQIWAHTRLARFGFDLSLFSQLSYPYFFIYFGGVTFFVIFIFGFVKLLRNFKPVNLIIILPILVTLLFQSFYTLKVLRALSPVLPLLSIIAGIGLNSIDKFLRNKAKFKYFGLIIFCLFLFESVYKIYPVLLFSNNFYQVVDFLHAHNISSAITTDKTNLYAYIPDGNFFVYQDEIQKADFNLQSAKYNNYLTTSIQKFTIVSRAKYITRDLNNNLLILQESCKPEVTIVQRIPKILISAFVFDHNGNLKNNLTFLRNYNYITDSNLNIYNLRKCNIR